MQNTLLRTNKKFENSSHRPPGLKRL